VLALTVAAGASGGAGDTVHTVNFATPGTTTWTVPGTGTVRVEMATNGAGGGGNGGVVGRMPQTCEVIGPGSSYPGGNGGAAVSTRVLIAGTVLTIVVGAGGAGGSWGNSLSSCGPLPTVGAQGGNSSVALGGTSYAVGVGGGPSTTVGGGTGDQVTTGGGAAGGAGGVVASINGVAGTAGKIQIRY
jgi:hypothetical protein